MGVGNYGVGYVTAIPRSNPRDKEFGEGETST
jgi:hypothetical protein